MPAAPTPAYSPPQQHPDLPASSPLQACPHCEALIDTTEREPLETISCPGCGAPLQLNGEIAGFQLVEVAGRGGMGVVYRAYDPGLDRHIAIKLLRKDHSSDSRFIEQLENEARITASINDPNVVRVYATGFDRGRFYLAMELVDKGSLDDLIRLQGRVAEAQILDVGIQIASGLRAASQHGLIHRDVKPGNILFGSTRTAKIVDFGLAMFANQIEESTGEIWGTPYYVPPEKLDGSIEDLRSDIYSLGATLFHALAGRPPFEAQNASLVALKHLKSQAVSLQSFAPWISNPTAHIINRTLAKNPGDRFQSYDDLIHNFEYALDQLHQDGGKKSSRARVVLETDEDRKTWTWVVLGMAAIILVLVGIFAFTRPKSQDTIAVVAAPAQTATPKPGETFGLKSELQALASRDENAARMMEAAAKREGAAEERAWAQLFEGAAYLNAGQSDKARTAFEKVGTLAADVKEPSLASFLNTVSTRLAKPGKISTVEALNFRKENYQAAGFLLYGLHDWQNGAIEDGATLLREFRKCIFSSDADKWLDELKPLASQFVQQVVSYQMTVEALQNATSASQRASAARDLRKLDPALAKSAEALIAPYEKEIAKFESGSTAIPEPGIYRIYNKHSGLVLDVEFRSRNERAKVIQFPSAGDTNQHWELVRVSADTFKIRAVHSGLLLNLPDKTTKPGASLWQWGDDNSAAGIWKLEPQGDGLFYIRSVASNQVLAVDGMSKSAGASVTQWDKPGTEDHLWRLEHVGERIGDWFVMDIGAEKGPASTKIDGNSISIGVNNLDIWTKKDSCRLVFRDVAGDFDLVAQLAEQSNVSDWSKTGIMVRDNVWPNSRNYLFGFSGRGDLVHQWRPANNADTTGDQAREGFKVPGWIKVTRRGSNFTGYHSRDGKTWTQVYSESVGFQNNIIVGFATSSWGAGKNFNLRYENVSLTQP
jgi:hypothetical protein